MPRHFCLAATLIAAAGFAWAAPHGPSAAELQQIRKQGGDWRAFLLRLESTHPYAADWLAQDSSGGDAAA